MDIVRTQTAFFSFPSVESTPTIKEVYNENEYNRSDFFWEPTFPEAPVFLDHTSCTYCSRTKYHYLKGMIPEWVNISKHFPGSAKSCAIVTGSTEMNKYYYGSEIDTHPVVLRLNLHQRHPTKREAEKYGQKTTHRMINNVFWNIKGEYNRHFEVFASMEETVILNHMGNSWYPYQPKTGREDLADLIRDFMGARAEKGNLYNSLILHPDLIEKTYLAFSELTKLKMPWTPSSGFIGMVMLSKICGSVHGYGFTPIKNTFHKMADEHKVYYRWKHDPNATVPLYLYP